jgi:biofilm protein TabA
MILDSLDQVPLYGRLSPGIARGFAWFGEFSPQMPDGRYTIDGTDVFALVQSYGTAPAAEKQYEAHRNYIDIQYVAAGTELIYHSPISGLHAITEYDPVKDFQLFADPAAATPLYLTPGRFALFYPHDAHKPGCSNGAPAAMKKVVIKVRV